MLVQSITDYGVDSKVVEWKHEKDMCRTGMFTTDYDDTLGQEPTISLTGPEKKYLKLGIVNGGC